MNIVIEKNVMVAMRDGVHLAADVYRPVEEGQHPVLLMRLPYNKDLPGRLAAFVSTAFRAAQQGYVVVLQDCRGRFASEGEFYPQFDDANDGVDTIHWIVEQPWANGKVGMIGGSYLGFTQWLLAKEHPEALRAIAPQVTTSNYYQTPMRHEGGVFELGVLFWALSMVPEEVQRRMRQGQASREQMGAIMQAMRDPSALMAHLPLVDQPLLREFAPWYLDWLNHPTYDDYWKRIAHSEYYEQLTVPTLNMGGWYDLFLGGTLANYVGMKQRGGSVVARAHQRLVIGPWSHTNDMGMFSERSYGLAASSAAIDLEGMQLRWHDHWLKGEENGVEQDKPVKIFVMGLDQWRDEDDWPLPDTQYRPYYLHSGGHANSATGNGTLSPDAPAEEPEDVYLYDPRHPVPTVGGAILIDLAPVEGPRDQRAVEAREDVLCYSTPVLEKPVEVTGPIALVLYISSSARDTDFTGKLVNVYPDGRAEILTDGILRARYRESFTEAKLLEPGQIYELRLDLWATSNLFKAGHRIRLEVSSSNFPRFDRNTNTGGVIERQTEKDLVQAVNRIYHDAAHPSHLILPIIERN
ncbi:MAG: X-Pro dipeptidyl-peptidase [Ktedonobacter sp. 13_1_20CM_4_53_11]|nr:MAG: X-Pro dipeptidyl-peptidase [Ktedonobacter sp. 13_1_20CM_4_53_11]